MFKPEVAQPESEENPEKSFDELQSKHITLSTQAQLLEQQLKNIRAEIISTARESNNAHPLLSKADEVWFGIFSHLPLQSRTLAQKSCARFFQLGTDPRLPAFPLDYTATPQYTNLNMYLASSTCSPYIFNLLSSKQFAIAEITARERFENANSTNLVYLINSYTGAEEARFKIKLPFMTIHLIGIVEKNKLLFVGDHEFRNTIEFLSYDLQSKKQEMIYQLTGQLSGKRTVLQLTTGQIVFHYRKSNARNEPVQVHIVTLETHSEPRKMIDVPLETQYPYFYEIKSGKFKNHLLLYYNNKFMILNLKGEIQKRIFIEENNLPPHFTIHEEQVQEPKANELIFNSGHHLLRLNLIRGAYTLLDFRFFDRWVMNKLIDQENTILTNIDEEAPKNTKNKLVIWNFCMRTRKEVAIYAVAEKPTHTFTLKNGNLVVRIEDTSSPRIRYALYRFPEQQCIAQPIKDATHVNTACPTRNRPDN